MHQARDARAGEDERVARLQNELEQCEAGLEKQLLDALVDGSAAKVPYAVPWLTLIFALLPDSGGCETERRRACKSPRKDEGLRKRGEERGGGAAETERGALDRTESNG